MNLFQTPLKDCLVIEPDMRKDQRGSFSRLFCQEQLASLLQGDNIVQINHSCTSRRGSVRGMHFQYAPKAEKKIIKCIKGKVYDVIVDLRRESKTFLKWHAIELSDEQPQLLYVPHGFAHGFQALQDDVEMLYMHTEYYSPEHQGKIRFDDPQLKISWPVDIADVSEEDRQALLITPGFDWKRT